LTTTCHGDNGDHRFGIVSAFGAEADILIEHTTDRQTHLLHGKHFTTGLLGGQRVVIVLCGVGMVNATMVTQLMLDHFGVERLLMSGIAGGVNPENHVGDVTVPDRWAMPMEAFWHGDPSPPSPCGTPGDVTCLGIKLAFDANGQPRPPFVMPTREGERHTGLFLRDNHLLNASTAPEGRHVFDYPVDAEMLEVARALAPPLARHGPKAVRLDGSIDARLCVHRQPRLLVGGRGVSTPVFLANAAYRHYLHDVLQAQTVDMETAALAHVAHANEVPFIAFRSLSDLAGADGFDADVAALYGGGLAELNASAVTLGFLQAWGARAHANEAGASGGV